MDDALFRLPLYTFCSGFVLKVIENISIKIFIATASAWTISQIESILFFVQVIGSLFFILLIGFYLQKQYSMKDFFLSSSLLVVYSIVVLLLEKALLFLGVYSMAVYFLHLPTYLFSFLNLILFHFIQGEIPAFFNILYLFFPYLFLLFAKKGKENHA